ncbi:MAG: recombinase family protein, partial [Armatimonadetes bacterium]|nr:recombinase family protein [Armatimonadota bacterium]
PTEEEKQRGVTASLVRNDEQGRWVAQMKDWYLAGWGIRRIAQALHDAGVPSPEGQEWWTFGSIRDTVLNPAHAGLNRVGDGKLVPGDWWDQRYFDDTTYQLLLAKAEHRRRTPPAALAAVHLPLLGVLRCGHCGNLLRGRRNQRTANLYYRCTTPIHKRTPQCARNAKPAAAVEEAVLGIITQPAAREDLQQFARQQAAHQLHQEDENLCAEIQRLEREIADTQQQMDRWAAFCQVTVAKPSLHGRAALAQDNSWAQNCAVHGLGGGAEVSLAPATSAMTSLANSYLTRCSGCRTRRTVWRPP